MKKERGCASLTWINNDWFKKHRSSNKTWFKFRWSDPTVTECSTNCLWVEPISDVSNPPPRGGAFMEFKKEPWWAEWRAARDHDRALKIGFSMQPFIFQHSGSRKLICTTPTKEVFQHSENRSPQRRSKENRFINLLFKLLFLIRFTCQSSPPDLSRFTSPHSFHI